MAKEVICGIYKITSPTGKVYIGEAVDIHRRWRHYKGLHCKRQPRIYNSLVKHLPENHTFDIIEVCGLSELKCRERYWQEFFEVLGKLGLNSQYTECGEEKQVHTQETKDKISKTNKGKVLSEETKQKLRDRPPMVFTEEHRKKISDANSGEGNYWFGIKGELHPSFGKEGLRGENHPHWGKRGELSHSWGKKATKEQRDAQSKRQSKLVLDLNTGVFYESCLEATTLLGIPSKRLSMYLTGARTNKTPLTYI